MRRLRTAGMFCLFIAAFEVLWGFCSVRWSLPYSRLWFVSILLYMACGYRVARLTPAPGSLLAASVSGAGLGIFDATVGNSIGYAAGALSRSSMSHFSGFMIISIVVSPIVGGVIALIGGVLERLVPVRSR